MKRKVWVQRKDKKLAMQRTWSIIASKVRNLLGETPFWKVCCDAFNELEKPKRAAKDSYSNCGRKLIGTKTLVKWIVRQMLKLRTDFDVTSTDLMHLLAKEKGIQVEDSSIRRALRVAGYKYLARSKKPKYSESQKLERLTFARPWANMSQKKIADELHMFMDGVVFVVPPNDLTERLNYCR